MIILELYEFSSGVEASRSGEFIQYKVGQYTFNSFLNSKIQITTKGIPKAIEIAINNDLFAVKTASTRKPALMARYLAENWVVLAVSDRLPGRPNEVYRYFCVQSKLTEEIDPMLSLIDWYIQKNAPRYDLNRSENINSIAIKVAAPHSGKKLSEQEQFILDTLNAKTSQKLNDIFLNIEEIRNIIASIKPLEKRLAFSWTLEAFNFNSLVRGEKYQLIQNPEGKLWINFSVLESSNITVFDKDFVIKKLDQLVKINEPERILNVIKELVQKNYEVKHWQNFFEIEINLKKWGTIQINEKYLIYLTIQAILIPEKIVEIVDFYNKKDKTVINSFETFTGQVRFAIEKKLIKNVENDLYQMDIFLNQIIENLYQGAKTSLEKSLNLSDIYRKDHQDFLLREINNKKGLWEYVLTNKVALDLYEDLGNSQTSIFSYDFQFLLELWKDDPWMKKLLEKLAQKENSEYEQISKLCAKNIQKPVDEAIQLTFGKLD